MEDKSLYIDGYSRFARIPIQNLPASTKTSSVTIYQTMHWSTSQSMIWWDELLKLL